jgi:hypothetical protein
MVLPAALHAVLERLLQPRTNAKLFISFLFILMEGKRKLARVWGISWSCKYAMSRQVCFVLAKEQQIIRLC